jgi:hypothetical protein
VQGSTSHNTLPSWLDNLRGELSSLRSQQAFYACLFSAPCTHKIMAALFNTEASRDAICMSYSTHR